MDAKQAALDQFTSAVVNTFCGQDTIPPLWEKGLRFVGIDVVALLNKTDDYIRPFMDDAGMVDGVKLRELVEIKHPHAAKLIPADKFSLVDKWNDTSAGVKQLIGVFRDGARTQKSLPLPGQNEAAHAGISANPA